MPQISIIVAIYNSEHTLKRCVDSILSQTYKDFELILINDGSTDYSEKICLQYKVTDRRIRYFHNKNQGISKTRQFGLECAKGNYILYVDSDDWIENNMLKEMITTAIKNNCDMVICDFYTHSSNTCKSIVVQEPLKSTEDILFQLFNKNLFGGTCNKLIKKRVFLDYNISFLPNMNYCEDFYVICQLILAKISTKRIPLALYHYDCYSNLSSLSKKITADTIQSYQILIENLKEKLTVYNDRILFRAYANHKKLAFRSNCSTKEYYKLYPNLKNEFISDIKLNEKNKIYRIAQVVALKGYLRFGRLLIKFHNVLYIPAAQVAHNFTNIITKNEKAHSFCHRLSHMWRR